MNCNECGKEGPKYRYKCCLLNFCSSECYKVHRCPKDSAESGDSGLKTVPSDAPLTPESHDTNLTRAQIDTLKADARLREFLGDEEMRRILVRIAGSKDPIEEAQAYLRDPRFTEFVNHVLEIIRGF